MKCPHCGEEFALSQLHSETSKAAGRRAIPNMTGQRKRIRNLLAERYPGGLTDEEIAVRLDMSPNSVRPRRVELMRMSAVCDSGLTRKTDSGSKAVVWCLTGREYYTRVCTE